MIKEKGVHVNFYSFNFRIIWTRNVEVTERVCECGIKFHAEKVLSHMPVAESWYNHSHTHSHRYILCKYNQKTVLLASCIAGL